MTASVTALRTEAPALAEYRAAEQAKAAAAARVFDAMVRALDEAEARCTEAASIDLPPGVRDLARRSADAIAEVGKNLLKIQGNVG